MMGLYFLDDLAGQTVQPHEDVEVDTLDWLPEDSGGNRVEREHDEQGRLGEAAP